MNMILEIIYLRRVSYSRRLESNGLLPLSNKTVIISRGLGVLSDGFVANGSPFDASHLNGSWIGWNKHHTGGTVTLLFEFDQLRNFSEILFAAYGHRMDSIDVIFR